jgi:hypothetical protein
MSVIHPSIFQVMRRFPEQRKEIVKCFNRSDSFRVICEDYKQCSKALHFWSQVDSEESVLRQAEYEELLQSLECEILLFVRKSGLIRVEI